MATFPSIRRVEGRRTRTARGAMNMRRFIEFSFSLLRCKKDRNEPNEKKTKTTGILKRGII